MRGEAAPRSIGPYRTLGIIGEGGMGVVYRAEHAVTSEVVALKTVRIPHESHLAGIRREIHALGRIRHPGVVRIVAEGVEGNIPWYAMELLEGRTLADVTRATWRVAPRAHAEAAITMAADDASNAQPDEPTALASFGTTSGTDTSLSIEQLATPTRERKREPLTPRRPAGGGRLIGAISLIRGLCETLAYLHGEGIVHRDLKPANVLIRPDETPVLMDFGLAWRFPAAASREVLEVSRALAGTPGYMSPEQIRGELVDARADLYAVGCMLYEAVTGRVPFAESALLLHARLSGTPTPPSDLVEGVPPALEELIAKLLATRPRDRIGHASDVARLLAELGADVRPMYPGKPRAYVYRPELTGREESLDKLVRHLAELKHGRGGAVLVGGESGIGKTYLSMAFARVAAARGVHVIAGSCAAPGAVKGDADPAGSALRAADAPLHPFLPLLQTIVDLCMERGAEFTRSILDDRAKVLAACEPSFARVPGHEDHPEPPELPAQAARERLLRAIGDALGRLAEDHPVLLVIDDLQWADELSFELLASLGEPYFEQYRVLVLGTYRAEGVGPALRHLLEKPLFSRIDLGRLDEAGVGSMVRDMLALDAAPAAFARFLAGRSDGNPFFVAEYVRTAVDAGLLSRDAGGKWRLADPGRGLDTYERLPLPGTLRALVAQRLDGLGAAARSLADVAAVIGREIDAELLASVAASAWEEGDAPAIEPESPSRREGSAEYAIMTAIRELIARQVLEEVEANRLRFLHDKLREITYERIPEDRLRALHRRTARAIEAEGLRAGGMAPRYPRLAHHFGRAGDAERAAHYLERAAEQSIKNFANRETVGFLEELLAIEDKRDDRPDLARRVRLARWERQLADASFALGDMDATTRHAKRALAWANQRPPESMSGWARSLLSAVPEQIAHRIAPAAFVSRDALERDLYREAALAMQRLSQRFYFLDAIAMIAGSLSAVNLAERAGGDVPVATPYGMLGMAMGIGKMQGLSRRYFALSRAAAIQTHDLDGLVLAFYGEATCLSGEGEWTAARALLERARELGIQSGNRAETETVETVIANADHLTGRFVESRQAFLGVLRTARDNGNQQHLAWGLYGAARAMIPLGEVDAALPLLEEARSVLAPQADLPSKIICLGLLAAARLARGDLGHAVEAADAATARIRENRLMAYAIVSGYAGVAEAYLARWTNDRASRAARKAAATAVRDLRILSFAIPIAAPYYQRHAGRLRLVEGDRAGARAAFEESLAGARRLSMPYDEATARVDIARLDPPGSTFRTAHLDRAAALFSEMSCPVPLAEIEALRRAG